MLYSKSQWSWAMICLLLLMTRVSNAEGSHISVIDYNPNENLLSLNVVVSGGGQPQLYLQSDGLLSELTRFTQIGDHKLVIHLPCDEFEPTDTLYYKIGKETLTLPLTKFSCAKVPGSLKEPKIIHNNNQCFIEPNGRTLWRISSLLELKNGYSVYQNLYAIFVLNRENFIGGDISKLKSGLLMCPPEDLIASIDKAHATEMYKEATLFQLSRATHSILSSNNELDTSAASVIASSGKLPAPLTDAATSHKRGPKIATTTSHIENKNVVKQKDVENILSTALKEDDKKVLNGSRLSSEKNQGDGKVVLVTKGDNNRARIDYIGERCFIDPQQKTLWRVGLTLSELNNFSIEQNMYAVYLANPLAFPKKDPRHMLNIKLKCPAIQSINRVTSHDASRKIKELSY